MSIRLQNRKKSRGFTLVEALLGFLILSVGMLGIASLQAVSLKAGKSSVYGSVAMMKVEELFESMRANPTSLVTYVGGVGIDNGCSVNVCDAIQLAEDDLFWWKKNLKAGLPDTASTTTVINVIAPVAPSSLATVSVSVNWKERNKSSAGGSVDRSYSATTGICVSNPC